MESPAPRQAVGGIPTFAGWQSGRRSCHLQFEEPQISQLGTFRKAGEKFSKIDPHISRLVAFWPDGNQWFGSDPSTAEQAGNKNERSQWSAHPAISVGIRPQQDFAIAIAGQVYSGNRQFAAAAAAVSSLYPAPAD